MIIASKEYGEKNKTVISNTRLNIIPYIWDFSLFNIPTNLNLIHISFTLDLFLMNN